MSETQGAYLVTWISAAVLSNGKAKYFLQDGMKLACRSKYSKNNYLARKHSART